MLTVRERILITTFNRVRFLEGKELDANMLSFFGIARLDGETDEEFLDRADDILFEEFNNGNL